MLRLDPILSHQFRLCIAESIHHQQRTSHITMKSTCLFMLASLAVSNLTVCGGQSIPNEDETDRRTMDDIVLQRAESLLLRSILKKLQDEDDRSGA